MKTQECAYPLQLRAAAFVAKQHLWGRFLCRRDSELMSASREIRENQLVYLLVKQIGSISWGLILVSASFVIVLDT